MYYDFVMLEEMQMTTGGADVTQRAWYWGSYGSQDITVGVVGFYKNSPTCRPGGTGLNPRTTDTALLRECLEGDTTTLNNYN